MVSDQNNHPNIHFERITAKTVREICRLSDTLPAQQRKMVARNGDSINT
jgi:diamine N-acetyltransferase